ncbi:hypothetical protein BX616_003737 [Lobosporangium transversale]|uniref:YCII-related domain-containing protein n=1 Tax=Lobosporangium transversale TaxID=64571 RepID=A0A1Y2H180_9FUNG|nr:hypothetical protein BCR41DRAFT_383150 [Lobosporangium transversale]KAF9898671.1 hypothetical protein BX616_003737 [Lobosporangium transversale]ORZ28308.1 hypothetical protein BCR41DRAFT_383150 [Lobosporangium transversale]|eukprot:XP_021885993.1 hypothetical protein BCR41DRAFT_383150 [Lobosporangium transversale]
MPNYNSQVSRRKAQESTLDVQPVISCTTVILNNKKQFFVIARDYQDPEAFNRRLSVRPTHLVGATSLKKTGALQLGGALLSDHSESAKMIGSIMVFNADSEKEVEEILKKDPYVTEKVWEHYQIIPFRQASF